MRRRWVVAILAALLIDAVFQFNAVFVWLTPTTERPTAADAVVVIDGDNSYLRLQTARGLIATGHAHTLVNDVSTLEHLQCPAAPGVVSVCFVPDPKTTQGEAQAIGAMALRAHWRSIILVVSQDQAWRAKLRFSRCFSGQIQVVAVPTTVGDQFYLTAYQDAAIVKAEIWNRSC